MSRREALAALGALGLSLHAGVGGAKGAATEKTEATGSSRNEGAGAKSAMKVMGVLGGLGPQATMDFEARVHRVAQRLIEPHLNGGYPPMVVTYCRHAPLLLNDDLSPRRPLQADPRLLEAARRLGAWADFLVIPSNTPHLFQKEIEQASGRKVLSMIETTLDEVRVRKWGRVGVLGYGDPFVYTGPLRERKVACETIDGEMRAALDGCVRKVMEGRDGAESDAIARETIAALRARKVDGIILGCTEIPLMFRGSADAPDLVNPAQLLAEAAVKYAIA
jgi:aspartate racemase